MNLITLCCIAFLGFQGGEQDRIAQLIQDLGSTDFVLREKADEELCRIGSTAVTALTKASEDKDSERALRARCVLARIQRSQKAHLDLTTLDGVPDGIMMEYSSWPEGITFRLQPDHQVELIAPRTDSATGKREFTTYRADSLDAFKKKYPEVARKYSIDHFVPQAVKAKDFGGWLKKWAEDFSTDASGFCPPFFPGLSLEHRDPFESMNHWVEEQRRLLDEFQERLSSSTAKVAGSPSPSFGVRVRPVDEALRAQLGLAEHPGLLVLAVEDGSSAQKIGVKVYDILLKVGGKPVTGLAQFHEDLCKVLESKSFTLDILRAGKPLSLLWSSGH